MTTQQTTDLNTAQVEQALGYTGKVNRGIVQFSVAGSEKITERTMRFSLRWVLRLLSTSSRREEVRQRSPATLSCLLAKAIR